MDPYLANLYVSATVLPGDLIGTCFIHVLGYRLKLLWRAWVVATRDLKVCLLPTPSLPRRPGCRTSTEPSGATIHAPWQRLQWECCGGLFFGWSFQTWEEEWLIDRISKFCWWWGGWFPMGLADHLRWLTASAHQSHDHRSFPCSVPSLGRQFIFTCWRASFMQNFQGHLWFFWLEGAFGNEENLPA